MREETDPALLGSEDDFDGFYLNEYHAVVSLALALSGNRWAAEDIAQEAFLVVHRNWARVSGYDQPALWVRRVAANLAVSLFRRSVAEAKAIARLAFDRARTISELSADDADFWRAVRSLPHRQAQVVALYYLEDRPISEVAAILEMAPGTVKKHLHDGRDTLARRLRLEEESQ